MADGQKKEIIKKRFGRYLLLDHLVDGGMAKICRARHLGEQADKIVALKMIQPQYSSDEAFRTMFMDEIKVAFGLIHPNICQTYDYGMQDGQLFTVMEYVDGKNLKQFLDKLREKKFVFPVEICLHITAQACQALHYAHTLTDKLTGNAFKIVHRDISPHNLMITYDGAVKVIDFGIAKASTNSEATQAGTIKGKLSYLAPEYLEGLELDHRYDEFALGITLWEMLCNRKLFKAENDLAVLKQIQACKIPAPSSINPNVPKQLDEIVLKALARDRNKRFKDMDAFNRELVKFLYSHYQNFNPSDLSYFAKDLFQEEIKVDRERFFEFGKVDIRPFLEEIKQEAEGKPAVSAPASSSADAMTQTLKKRDIVIEYELDEDIKQEMTAKKKTRGILPKSERAKSEKVAAAATQTGATSPVAAPATPSTSAPASSGTGSGSTSLSIDKTRKDATNPGMKVGQGTRVQVKARTAEGTRRTSMTKLQSAHKAKEEKKEGSSKKVLVAAAIACLVIVGTQYQTVKTYLGLENSDTVVTKTDSTTGTGARGPASAPTAVAEATPAVHKGSITFESFDKYKHKVFINGKYQEVSLLGEVIVNEFGDLTVRVEQQGFKHFVTVVHLAEGQTSARIKIPEQPPESFGQLVTSRGCAEGKIFFELYGEKRIETIPIEHPILFPTGSDGNTGVAPATYEISFQRDGEDYQRKLTFTVNYQDDSIDFCSLLNR